MSAPGAVAPARSTGRSLRRGGSALAPSSPEAEREERRPRKRSQPVAGILVLGILALISLGIAALFFLGSEGAGHELNQRLAAGEVDPEEMPYLEQGVRALLIAGIVVAGVGLAFGAGAILAPRYPRGATLFGALLFTPLPLILLLGAFGDLATGQSALGLGSVIMFGLPLGMLAAAWGAVYDGFRVARLRQQAARKRGGARGIKGGRGLRGVY